MTDHEVDKSTKQKPFSKTIHEYASVCSPHGIFYIFESDRLPFERILWVLVVGLFIGFAINWSISAYENWKKYPILTTVATTGLAIEELPFPSITICAQGSANDIVDAALFNQLERYLAKKNISFDSLSDEEKVIQTQNFLNETYPGATKTPNQLVQMMGSPSVSVESKLDSIAIINPGDHEDCTEIGNAVDKRRKRGTEEMYVEEYCPDEFFKVDNTEVGQCIHISSEQMTKEKASDYCTSKGAGNSALFSAYPNDDLENILKESYSMLKGNHFLVLATKQKLI